VAVLIATGAVDRSVAEAVVGWMLALTHRVAAKHRIVQTGAWDTRSRYMGCELRDRALGVIGLGGIARSLIKLLDGWGMKQPLAFDPYADPAAASAAGVRLVTLNELLSASDFVSIHCPLTPATRNLIGAEQLALMKPGSYLLNTARGGIVDEHALGLALREGRLAGAGIDCFAEEPVRAPHPLAEFENVLLAPHCIAWTEELFRDIGRTVSAGLLAMSNGQKPKGLVNPEVLQRPGFIQKWNRLTTGIKSS
jgi:phosphoglycerate dehydrogenase-like enzyme